MFCIYDWDWDWDCGWYLTIASILSEVIVIALISIYINELGNINWSEFSETD